MSPNLYDLLDVDQAASAEEIRAAWKAAIADLEPTDRRFGVYNDAAGVLLDPDRRTAYDAELAEQQAEQQAAEDAAEQPAAPADEPAPTAAAGTPPTTDRSPTTAPTGPPGWAFGAAAVAAVLVLALAITLLFAPGGLFSGEKSPEAIAERNSTYERAALSAETAAERMVPPVLSYDYRTMDEDLERIRGQMTEEMGAKQAKGWEQVTEEATAQKVVVEASAVGSAVSRVAPDGRRATVVVFVDQNVEKRGAEPFVLRMWATLSLVRAAGSEERWLLDDLCTDSDCQ